MVLVVPDRAVHVDPALAAGQLSCPDCSGELRPWGWARRRAVRAADRVRVLRPRRSRCRACAATHVLLPAWVLLHRAYAVPVIGAALLAAARGQGHRRVAAHVGVPAATVRGWLRRLRVRAHELIAYSTRLVYRFDASASRLDPPAGWASPTHAAVGLLGTAAAAYTRLLGPSELAGWELVCALTGGLLLANTSRPYPPVL